MLLGELLSQPQFGLCLLVDPTNAASVAVTRVFSTDQPLPQRYMSGGELVLTGLIFHSGTAAESDAFVDSAVAGGAVAIGAGVDRFGSIPEHFVAACSRNGVPLFSVPADVSFADMTQVLIDQATAASMQVRRSLARSRSLLDAVAKGHALDDIAAQVVAATGLSCWVLTASGKRVVAVGTALAEDQVDAILAAAAGTERMLFSTDRFTVMPVGARLDRAADWYLVLDSPMGDIAPEAMDAFGEFAAIAALVRARNADAIRVREAEDDALVAKLGSLDAPTLAAGVVVVVQGGDPRRTRAIVRDALVAFSDVVVGAAPDAVIAHVPSPRNIEELAECLRRHLGRVAGFLGVPLRAGLSAQTPADYLGGALRNARHAATLGSGSVSVTSAAVLGSAMALLAHFPDGLLSDFAQRVLGPVLEHDAQTSAGLVSTLQTFLDHAGSWLRTAEALHLHTNTVRYRIGKAEELLGRDLATTADRTDVYLALALWSGASSGPGAMSR